MPETAGVVSGDSGLVGSYLATVVDTGLVEETAKINGNQSFVRGQISILTYKLLAAPESRWFAAAAFACGGP